MTEQPPLTIGRRNTTRGPCSVCGGNFALRLDGKPSAHKSGAGPYPGGYLQAATASGGDNTSRPVL